MRKIPAKYNENLTICEFDSEQEWLEFRKDRIGASDVSIILGVSKWKTNDGRIKTPRLLWMEKLGLDKADCDNVATRYGKAMEEPARQMYQKIVGEEFKATCIINKKYPYLMVSLDGLNITQDHAVEIKNCCEADHLLAKEGKVPAKYIPQVQTQAMVTELPFVSYFSVHNEDGAIVKSAKDEDYCKMLEKELSKFWECVETMKEPALTDNDFIDKGDDWLKKAKELFEVQQAKKIATDQEKILKEELKLLSEHRNARSGDFLYTCSVGIGRVDYKSIPALLDVDLSQFVGKPIESWRLRKLKTA